MLTVRTAVTDPATTRTDALILGVASNGSGGPVLVPGSAAVDAAFGGRLAQHLADLRASGKQGEVTRLAALGAVSAPVVVAVGLGQRGDHYDDERLRRAAGAATRALAGVQRVATTLALANGQPGRGEIGAVAEGAVLGAYSFTRYRPSPDPARTPVEQMTVLGAGRNSTTKAALQRASVVAEAVALVRDLVNTPGSDLPPEKLAGLATEVATGAGVGVRVWDDRALRRGGFGGLTGVGQGSSRGPRLVRLQWRHPKAGRTVALVGKGITFDSGGLSLKPSEAMQWMKSDMAGAAVVLATVVAAARLNLPVNVTGWLPTAENLPSGTAIRPSDVLTMYGGKTVEVLNTDAEGRLVLADALVRAAEESPDYLVDIATLTGAQSVALGQRTTGVMGNDDAWRSRVVGAGQVAGEALWPMPFPEELRATLDSPVADLANIGDRFGGMLTAGIFLGEFVPDGLPWVHLDIAGPAFHRGEPYGYTSKGGTGTGVRTLLALLDDVSTAG